MLAAIDLDDEPGFQTDEIDDVGAKGELAAEFMTVQIAQAELTPEVTFGIGQVGSELAGAVDF